MRFQGKTVFVTGSSRGIGRATVLAFAQEGANNVVINYKDDATGANDVRAAVTERGAAVLVAPADVAVYQEVEDAVGKTVELFGRIDVLVNNAGITADRTAAKMALEDWQRVLDVNLTGVFNATRAALPHMLNQRMGAIVSVASVVGLAGNFGQANYAAAKAGIIGMTKSIAREVAAKGVRINAVAPGFIETDMVRAMPLDVLDRVRAATPMGRLGLPEEVARAVLFLASDDASFITGETLNVNGGFHFH